MVKKITKPYVDNYIFSENNYYVHKYSFHIGMADGGNFTGPQALTSIYMQQRDQARQAVRTQYYDLLKDSITISDDSLYLLNDLFENNSYDFLRFAEEQLHTLLEDSLNKEKAFELMELYKKTTNIANNFFSENSKTALQGLDEMLEVLEKGAELLEGESQNIANALLISRGKIKNTKNLFVRTGTLLEQAVKKYGGSMEGKSIDVQRAAAAANAINSLAKQLKTGKTAKGENMTKESFRKAFQYIFNTGFAEGLAGFFSGIADNGITESLQSLVGSDKVEVQLTDENGKPITNKNEGKTKEYGKADLKLKNVNMQVINNITGVVGNVSVDVGISNKFYKSQGFISSASKQQNFTFSGGESGTVADILGSLFGTSRNRYLAYNTLYHHKGGQDYNALIRLMTLRNIVRGFASRGGKQDFAQFIYFNGKIISILDIIEDYNSDLVDLKIDNDLGANFQSLKDTRKRVRKINEAFSSASTSMKIHLNNLRNIA